MRSATEIAIQRRATTQFIDENYSDVILKSRGEAYFDKGTKKFGNPVIRAVQKFRLIWLEEKGIYERPPEGTRKFDFVIVGNHDATVAIGDYWKIGEQEFRIESVTPSNGWEVKAYGVSHGPKPS